ncbi:AI-2E family transporter [Luteolibacter pohnpeiensis]|uniref:AI-2E family transporter n=1 Tax=Luteolibacter pohnpeiensis TaxID=454153 RepID=A0A934VVH5_9BACT|nr:AI-2E family transporter [Luteolibacter pohnpeiensis]MBK1882185.1 AI-2E family transporter [Luteolibacter pohnpeiensis]
MEPILGGLALFLLLLGCVLVLRPFLSAVIWAIVLAYSLSPLQKRFTRWFRGSRTLAACLVTLTLTVTLAGPLTVIGFSVAEDGKSLATATKKWFSTPPANPPEWLANLPVVGDEVTTYWSEFSAGQKRWMDDLERASHVEENAPRPQIVVEDGEDPILKDAPPVEPIAPKVASEEAPDDAADGPHSTNMVILLGKIIAWARGWLLSVGVTLLQGISQVLISAFLTFFLLRDASVLSERLGVTVDRLAGWRGRRLLQVAGDTVRGVMYGIIGTALAQALVAGLGFWIAGVPGPVLLAGLTFFFAVIPFGPPLVWIPAALWLFSQETPGWGIFMLVWGIFGISGVDNILRPYLISANSKMPFALIFCGVIGGALSFGLAGVFLGPTLLAVAFRLIEEWSANPAMARRSAEDETSSGLQEELGSAKPLHGGSSISAG